MLTVKECKGRNENIKAVTRFNVGELEDIWLFLHAKLLGDATKEFQEEMKGLLKEGLVEKVVRRIENLWPEYCRCCNKYSSYQTNDYIELLCLCCSRGACRDCYKVDTPVYNNLIMKEAGVYYLCNTCFSQVEQQDKMTEKKRAQKGPKKKTAAASASQADIDKEDFDEDKDEEEDEGEEEEEEEEEEDEVEEEELENNENMETVARKKKNETKKMRQKEKKEEAKKTCLHYERNRCKHGVQGTGCKYSHPKICPNVSKEGPGGCKVKNCSLYHAKVCYGSLATPKVCMKNNCTYRHLPETKRAASRKEQEETRREEERLRKEQGKKDQNERKEEERRRRREEEERLESMPPLPPTGGARRKSSAFLGAAGAAQEMAGPVVEMMVELLSQMREMVSSVKLQQQQTMRMVQQQQPVGPRVQEEYLVQPALQGAWGRPLVPRPTGQ